VTKATTIGLDIAKQVFQVHGADRTGRRVLRRKLRRSEVVRFFSEMPACLIGIEASGSAHHWARVLGRLGHTVRLMAPQFVKPYVKSQKNDANDADPRLQDGRSHLRPYSQFRVISAPPDLPDGAYVVAFSSRAFSTRKERGWWVMESLF
jgi:hypothetical protein